MGAGTVANELLFLVLILAVYLHVGQRNVRRKQAKSCGATRKGPPRIGGLPVPPGEGRRLYLRNIRPPPIPPSRPVTTDFLGPVLHFKCLPTQSAGSLSQLPPSALFNHLHRTAYSKRNFQTHLTMKAALFIFSTLLAGALAQEAPAQDPADSAPDVAV